MTELEYFRPESLEELLDVQRLHGAGASYLAGGTNILPDMRAGHFNPPVLIDLTRISQLSEIRETEDSIIIGPTVVMATLASSEIIRKQLPALAEAAGALGNHLTRNRATLGGNVVNASPGADTVPALMALEAEVETTNGSGQTRWTPIDSFFTDYKCCSLNSGEFVSAFVIAKPHRNARMGFYKLGLRNAAAISIINAAACLVMDGDKCEKARIAMGSVAPVTVRCRNAEAALEGRVIDQSIWSDLDEALQKDIHPIDDIRGSAEYRRMTAPAILKKIIVRALEQGV